MKTPSPILKVACTAALALAAGGVLAQSPTPTVTDVSPPPAEDRSSTGAIVLHNSMVRAQRDRDFESSSSRTGVLSVGRGVLRETMKAKAQADLAQAREQEAVERYRRGAASQNEQ